MGRLWQTLILSQWNPVFATAPVESMVRAQQQEYYAALNRSTKKGDSAPFVEFMLDVIRETLGHMESDQVSDQVKRLLRILGQEFTAVPEMMAGLALSHRPTFRKNYLCAAHRQELVEMKFPENPKHSGQRYRLTLKGRGIRAMLAGRQS